MTYRDAGRPIPAWTDDDVLDFLITEAIRMKIGEEQKAAQETAQNQADREAFRKGHKGMSVADLAAETKARG